jgi:hypothetical protein
MEAKGPSTTMEKGEKALRTSTLEKLAVAMGLKGEQLQD